MWDGVSFIGAVAFVLQNSVAVFLHLRSCQAGCPVQFAFLSSAYPNSSDESTILRSNWNPSYVWMSAANCSKVRKVPSTTTPPSEM